ncbi:MAG: COR domain-containing protein [Bacteroidota bacterium]
MREQGKCNLYIVGDRAVGKTTLIRKLAEEKNLFPGKTRELQIVDWIIEEDDKTVIVEIKERAPLGKNSLTYFGKENPEKSVIVIVITPPKYTRGNVFSNYWQNFINTISPNNIVIVLFNVKNNNKNIDFNSVRAKHPIIREIFYSSDFWKEEFEEFKFFLRQTIINAFTGRLDYVRVLIKNNFITKNKTLDLGNCYLTSLYEVKELFDSIHLEKLILSNEWAAFRNIKWHNIQSKNSGGKNSLGVIPLEINRLSKLKQLIIGGDWNDTNNRWNRWRINDLNPLITLKELEYLNLSNNRIKHVPSIKKIKKLKVLHLNNNEISRIYSFGEFESLEEIYLSNNQLTNVAFLRKLKNVKTIDLHANKIKDITPLKTLIEGLNINNSKWEQDTINIAKNPLETPPIEIVNTSKEAVLSYFKDISAGKPFINKDVKLILVGNSEVGKTTLAKYFNKEIDLEKQHSPTHWLDEKLLKSKHIIGKIKEKCNINLFDFGGHDYFHDTHHLFFGSNTIYILLWDKETNKLNFRTTSQENIKKEFVQVQTQDYPLKYWLDSIKYFIKEKKTENFEFDSNKTDDYNSLVLVVQNKVHNAKDIVHLDNNAIVSDYSFIYEFVNISIKPKRNLDYLDTLLVDILNKTQIIGANLPGYYGEVKKNIKNYTGNPILTIVQFQNYCNSVLKTALTLKQSEFLADYLKQIGVVLYYPKGNTDDKIYINKKWVIDQIYVVLEGLTEKKGEFDLTYLNNVLGNNLGQDQINSVIQLMIEFKIIFKHPDTDCFIAPLYLPAKPIQSVKLFIDENKWAYRRFIYKGFIQKNVILNFFQEYGKLVLKEDSNAIKELYYYWKDGLIVKDTDSNEIVMVKFHLGDNEGNAFIDVIKINTETKTKFTDKIIHYLKEINENYEIEEMVTLDGKHFVSLDVLNKNAKEGKLIFTERSIRDTIKSEEKMKEFKLQDYKSFLESGIKRKKVVISYSKKDLEKVHTLIRYLKPLEDMDLIEHPWYCTAMNPADEWDIKIQSKFNDADIIIFMVSEYFYSTEYIIEKEIKAAIHKYDNGTEKSVKIIPIILEHYEWGRIHPYNLKRFSALPYQGKPISDFNNEKMAWNTITICIRTMIEKDLDPAKIDIISRELQEIYERQVKGKLDLNSR